MRVPNLNNTIIIGTITFFVSLGLLETCHAGLGLTLDQCKEQYGEITSTNEPEGNEQIVVYEFKVGDRTVSCVFAKQSETCVSMRYIKDSRNRFSKDELEKILKSNGKNTNWIADEEFLSFYEFDPEYERQYDPARRFLRKLGGPYYERKGKTAKYFGWSEFRVYSADYESLANPQD